MSLPNPPSKYVLAWLSDTPNGLNGVTGWPADYGQEKTGPYKFVTLYDTTPVLDGRNMRTGEPVVHEGLMLRIKAMSYTEGWKKAAQLLDLLTKTLKLTTITLADSTAVQVAAFHLTSGPTFVGTVENNRMSVFTVNGTLTLQQV